MKFTQTTLDKIEKIIEESGYVIRYEKGNFNAGYCLVENRKIVIVNKFYETEGRINILLDILQTLEFEAAILGEKSAKFYRQIQKQEPVEEDES